jgi:hypothetical protein
MHPDVPAHTTDMSLQFYLSILFGSPYVFSSGAIFHVASIIWMGTNSWRASPRVSSG